MHSSRLTHLNSNSYCKCNIMFLQIDRLEAELAAPKKADPSAAAPGSELFGDQDRLIRRKRLLFIKHITAYKYCIG
jgi:hypothetical protein